MKKKRNKHNKVNKIRKDNKRKIEKKLFRSGSTNNYFHLKSSISWCYLLHFDKNAFNFCITKVVEMYFSVISFNFWCFLKFFPYLFFLSLWAAKLCLTKVGLPLIKSFFVSASIKNMFQLQSNLSIVYLLNSQAYSKFCLASKMEQLAKIINV